MFFSTSVSFVLLVEADVPEAVPDAVVPVVAVAGTPPTSKLILATFVAEPLRSESVEPSSAWNVLDVVA